MQIFQGDLHIHSSYSDGILAPEDIIRIAESRALNFIGIADHHCLSGTREAMRFIEATHSPVEGIWCQEASCGHQMHLLILGCKTVHHSIDLKRLDEFAAGIKKEGGALVVAHPWSFFFSRKTVAILNDLVREKIVDGLELMNLAFAGDADDWEKMLIHYEKNWIDKGLAILGGSDWHSPRFGHVIGAARTYLWADNAGERSILDAVRKGYCTGGASALLLKESGNWQKTDGILRRIFGKGSGVIYRDGVLGPEYLVSELMAARENRSRQPDIDFNRLKRYYY
ncbi:MAG: hypothetical protein ACM3WV_10140 [Bacillota bacterium]